MLSYSRHFMLAVLGCAPHILRASVIPDERPPQLPASADDPRSGVDRRHVGFIPRDEAPTPPALGSRVRTCRIAAFAAFRLDPPSTGERFAKQTGTSAKR